MTDSPSNQDEPVDDELADDEPVPSAPSDADASHDERPEADTPEPDASPEPMDIEPIEVAPADAVPSPTDEELLEAAAAPYEPPSEPQDTTEGASSGGPPPPTEPLGGAAQDHRPPPPHAAPAPESGRPYRRLYRSRRDRRLGGVAGGLARYFDIDPTIVRIAFVALALTGVSILLYFVAWIIIPKHPEGEPEEVWHSPRGTDRVLAAAVGLAALGLAVAVISESWLFLSLVLIGGGIWLLNERPDGDENPLRRLAGSGEGTWSAEPATVGAAAATASGSAARGSDAGAAYPPPPPSSWATAGAAEPPAATPRPRQRITWVVLSLLALLIALGIAAASGDWWDVSGTRLLGIGVLTVGLGVVAGAINGGGARGLIPLGIVGVLALVPVNAVEDVVRDGVGEVRYMPQTLADLRADYTHGIGEMRIDLRNLDLNGERRVLDISLGIGEVEVLLPDTVGGSAEMHTDAGELVVDLPGTRDDATYDGIGVDSERIVLRGDDGELELRIDVGLGVAELRSN